VEKKPEDWLIELVESLNGVESVLDVGTGHSGVFCYHYWQSKPLKRKACLDIALIREDIDPSWERWYADARSLPFPDDSFDVVMCCETLEHIPPRDHRRVLRELKRVAKKLVFITASGKGQHRGPEQRELERRNPYARFIAFPDIEILKGEGFRILFLKPERHVKAYWKP